MNINATLLGQAITFGILIWFTMRYVWPPIMKAMDERQEKIADGLAAARESEAAFERAQVQIQQELITARQQAAGIVDQAHKRADLVVQEAQAHAKAEGQRLLAAAQQDIEHASLQAKEKLRTEVVSLATLMAEKLMRQKLDKGMHDALLNQWVKEL